MNIIIAGASGFIGQALLTSLRASGHDVRRLVRVRTGEPDAIAWDPERRHIAAGELDGADAIVNLAGENIAGGRWSAARRRAILRSRIDATATLVDATGRVAQKPALLVNASAVGCYGDRGDAVVDEISPVGAGFLAEVCESWEAEAAAAGAHGVRVVFLRLGLVLGHGGGALQKLLPAFRWGLGGPLGSGGQWMSWVHRDDVIGIIAHALRDQRMRGPVNAVAPNPVTNAEFTRTLGRVLGRPAVLPVPAFALKAAFGQMANEALLGSTRAIPRKLQELGFEFRYPELEAALTEAVGPR